MAEGDELAPECEKFLTVSAAAEALGIPSFKIQRAIRRGLFPSYQIGNKRRLVRLSEIIAAVERMASP